MTPADPAADSSASKVDNLEAAALWGQLQNAISTRLGIEQVFWSSFGMFWATNAILIVALFSVLPIEESQGSIRSILAPLIISLVGLIQVAVWAIIQDRVLAHLERTEALMVRIEKSLQLGPKYAVSLQLSDPDFKKFIDKGLSTRIAVKITIVVIAAIWITVMAAMAIAA